jgi:hypothetical protein
VLLSHKHVEFEYPFKYINDINNGLCDTAFGDNVKSTSLVYEPTSATSGTLTITFLGGDEQELESELSDFVYNYVQRNWFTKLVDSVFD